MLGVLTVKTVTAQETKTWRTWQQYIHEVPVCECSNVNVLNTSQQFVTDQATHILDVQWHNKHSHVSLNSSGNVSFNSSLTNTLHSLPPPPSPNSTLSYFKDHLPSVLFAFLWTLIHQLDLFTNKTNVRLIRSLISTLYDVVDYN